MRSSKLGAGNRHGIISHIGISETDSLATREDPKKAKKQSVGDLRKLAGKALQELEDALKVMCSAEKDIMDYVSQTASI